MSTAAVTITITSTSSPWVGHARLALLISLSLGYPRHGVLTTRVDLTVNTYAPEGPKDEIHIIAMHYI